MRIDTLCSFTSMKKVSPAEQQPTTPRGQCNGVRAENQSGVSDDTLGGKLLSNLIMSPALQRK